MESRSCALCNRCTDPSCCPSPCHHLKPAARESEDIPTVLLILWVLSVIIFVVGAIKGW